MTCFAYPLILQWEFTWLSINTAFQRIGYKMESRIKLSNYPASNVNHEYTYLSSLFSSVEGSTIKNYFIEQRIEKAKELLMYVWSTYFTTDCIRFRIQQCGTSLQTFQKDNRFNPYPF